MGNLRGGMGNRKNHQATFVRVLSGERNEGEMPVDKTMNVLVVDDYKTMIRIVRSLLQQLGFCNIDDAADGVTALELLKGKSYGLVLSDWNMQPMSGLDLLKAVRADERTKSIPFIMVTAETKTENVVAARQAGVNNYVIKPFTLAVLKQKLTAVLGEL
jgi:two-component system, chemotaxis family, chemotaxis protein CheY